MAPGVIGFPIPTTRHNHRLYLRGNLPLYAAHDTVLPHQQIGMIAARIISVAGESLRQSLVELRRATQTATPDIRIIKGGRGQ